MSKTPDPLEYFKAIMNDGMMDVNSASAMFAGASEYAAKLSKIALEAAEKSAELSNAWTKQSLKKLEAFGEPLSEPTQIAKISSEIAAAQAQEAPEHLAKFAEVAKSAQMATIELLMSAGREAQNGVADAAKKAAARGAKAT